MYTELKASHLQKTLTEVFEECLGVLHSEDDEATLS